MRSDHASVAARLLSSLVSTDGLPSFLQPLDRFLLALGANLSRSLPALVVPAARVRMRQFVDTFVRDYNHLRFTDRISRNVNLLGEAVLGDEEAARRRNAVLELLQTPGIDYVSVKVSGVTSQLNRWDFDGSLQRVLASLRPLFERALNSDPRVLINLDMEEYHDLEITVSAFKILLEEPQFQDLDAGIVLQTYLPDALPVLQDLVQWAHERPGTGEIKIRLVKGANLAMEKVDAAMHGWTQAPYDLKSETDANYMRCLNWVLTPPRMERVRIGVASHNLFLLAYAHLLARNRGVGHRIGFEMLQGMTPTHTPLLAEQGHGMLLYTPICRAEDFDVAISYLFRRFEETTADGNFLRSLHSLTPESPAFRLEEYRFRTSAAKKNVVSLGPRRLQIRPAPASVMNTKGSAEFCNEPDTDPALRSNRIWAARLLNPSLHKPVSASSRVDTTEHMRTVLERGRLASVAWSEGVGTEKRKALFSRIADEMARRRGDLINAMVFEGRKIFAEADPEVSEAIDFANYYGMRGSELPPNFQNLGLICVAAPWNFPVAISSGGMLAALAAGNSVILKPSSLTPRCAELVAECAWAAGVPRDVLQLVRCSESEVGKTLITESDGVILTGASDTAKMFRSWKNDIRLFAEVCNASFSFPNP